VYTEDRSAIRDDRSRPEAVVEWRLVGTSRGAV
jgi:hypothetical protein